MMWQIIIDAIALMMVLEGLLPFLNPHKYRRLLVTILQQPEHKLRRFGLALMISGVVIASLVHLVS